MTGQSEVVNTHTHTQILLHKVKKPLTTLPWQLITILTFIHIIPLGSKSRNSKLSPKKLTYYIHKLWTE